MAGRAQPAQILLAVDEFSAVARRLPIWQLYERARSLGLAVQVSAQSWHGLAPEEGDRYRIASAAEGGIWLLRSAHPEPVAALAGQRKAADTTRYLLGFPAGAGRAAPGCGTSRSWIPRSSARSTSARPPTSTAAASPIRRSNGLSPGLPRWRPARDRRSRRPRRRRPEPPDRPGAPDSRRAARRQRVPGPGVRPRARARPARDADDRPRPVPRTRPGAQPGTRRRRRPRPPGAASRPRPIRTAPTAAIPPTFAAAAAAYAALRTPDGRGEALADLLAPGDTISPRP